jgi:hypothetical protein
MKGFIRKATAILLALSLLALPLSLFGGIAPAFANVDEQLLGSRDAKVILYDGTLWSLNEITPLLFAEDTDLTAAVSVDDEVLTLGDLKKLLEIDSQINLAGSGFSLLEDEPDYDDDKAAFDAADAVDQAFADKAQSVTYDYYYYDPKNYDRFPYFNPDETDSHYIDGSAVQDREFTVDGSYFNIQTDKTPAIDWTSGKKVFFETVTDIDSDHVSGGLSPKSITIPHYITTDWPLPPVTNGKVSVTTGFNSQNLAYLQDTFTFAGDNYSGEIHGRSYVWFSSQVSWGSPFTYDLNPFLLNGRIRGVEVSLTPMVDLITLIYNPSEFSVPLAHPTDLTVQSLFPSAWLEDMATQYKPHYTNLTLKKGTVMDLPTRNNTFTFLFDDRVPKITDVTVPAGTYGPGESVPIVVTFDQYMQADDAFELVVGGAAAPGFEPAEQTTLKPLEGNGSVSRTFSFLYTVKEIDDLTLHIDSIRGAKEYITRMNMEAYSMRDFDEVKFATPQRSLSFSGLTADKAYYSASGDTAVITIAYKDAYTWLDTDGQDGQPNALDSLKIGYNGRFYPVERDRDPVTNEIIDGTLKATVPLPLSTDQSGFYVACRLFIDESWEADYSKWSYDKDNFKYIPTQSKSVFVAPFSAVTDIKIDRSSYPADNTISMTGDPVTLTATITATTGGDGGTFPDLAWESSDTDVATIDNNGKITPTGVGKVRFTVYATNGYHDVFGGFVPSDQSDEITVTDDGETRLRFDSGLNVSV